MTQSTGVDHEQLVADLAWEFCKKSRLRKNVQMDYYLEQCPNDETRKAFKELVNADLLLGLARQRKGPAQKDQLV